MYAQSNLASLGDRIRIPKLSSADSNEKTALQWLNENPQDFYDYAANDAIIPVESLLSLMNCKNELALVLSELNVIPQKDSAIVKRFFQKTFLPTAGIADAVIQMCIEYQSRKFSFKALQSWEEERLANQAKRSKGGLNKVFVETPTLLKNKRF